MHEATRDLLVSEAKADRADLRERTRKEVGDGDPCRICGALISFPDGIPIHVEWHFRPRAEALRVAPHPAE